MQGLWFSILPARFSFILLWVLNLQNPVLQRWSYHYSIFKSSCFSGTLCWRWTDQDLYKTNTNKGENLFWPFISLHCILLWRTSYNVSAFQWHIATSPLCSYRLKSCCQITEIWYHYSYRHTQSQFNRLHREERGRGRQRQKLRKNVTWLAKEG